MTAYLAPTRDMQFVINELAGFADIAALPAFTEQEVNPELVEAVLEEAARLAGQLQAHQEQAAALLARINPVEGKAASTRKKGGE